MSGIDDILEELSKEENITSKRKEKEAYFAGLGSEEYYYIRKRCKNDLFFLCSAVLGFKKLSPNLHGHYFKWKMVNRDWRFKLELLPRGHYKTTGNIGDSIRIVLPDDGGNAPHPEHLGPEGSVLIGHEVAERASEILLGVQLHFLSNPLLMGFFPELVPSAKKQRINRNMLELPRQSLMNTPTFGTIGVGGRSQGMHFNYLKLDDLIGDKARDSKADMDAAKSWFNNIQSFFSDFDIDHMDVIGTRWAVDDLYSHIMDVYEEELIRYVRPAEEFNLETKRFEPIFPEQFSSKSFKILKKDPVIWNAQYSNNPEVTGRKLKLEWLKYFEWTKSSAFSPRVAIFTTVDGHPKSEVFEIWDMDRVMLCDPAVTGLASIVVVGYTGVKLFTLEAERGVYAPREYINRIFQLQAKWKCRLVSMEEVTFSALFKPWMEDEMKRRKFYFHIEPFKVENKAKDARTLGLASYYEDGQIFHHESQEDLIDEYKHFGTVEQYHILDAFAQAPHVIYKPITQQRKLDRQAAEAKLLAQRNATTGYS